MTNYHSFAVVRSLIAVLLIFVAIEAQAVPVTVKYKYSRTYWNPAGLKYDMYRVWVADLGEATRGVVPPRAFHIVFCLPDAGRCVWGSDHINIRNSNTPAKPGENASDAVRRWLEKYGSIGAATSTFAYRPNHRPSLEQFGCGGLWYYDSAFYPISPVPGGVCGHLPPEENRQCSVAQSIEYSFIGDPATLPGATQDRTVHVTCDAPSTVVLKTASDIRLGEDLTAKLSVKNTNLTDGVTLTVGEQPISVTVTATLRGKNVEPGVVSGSTVLVVDMI